MRESEYQQHVKKRLLEDFPGAIVLKNDPNWIQGLPDLTVLYRDRWATLEVKASADKPHRPNQDHYVEVMSEMSYSAFLYPENEEEVFRDLQRTLGA